ncbi:hypothetical protein JW859_00525 [bacterium]|nr:hypothetical protein [bacterium]
MHQIYLPLIVVFLLWAGPVLAADGRIDPPLRVVHSWTAELPVDLATLVPAPGLGLILAVTCDGDVCAYDSEGTQRWIYASGILGVDVEVAADGRIWLFDAPEVAVLDADGREVWRRIVAETPPLKRIRYAAATLIDPNSSTVWGIQSNGDYAWGVHGLAPSTLLSRHLLGAGGQFIVEATDFDELTQEFIALGADAYLKWRFDATPYTELPINVQYARPRADGSFLLATCTQPGELGGELGQYGPVVAVGADGRLEWEYPELAYLFEPAADGDGSCHLLLPDYTIRCIDRDGTERWAYGYNPAQRLHACLTRPNGGAVVVTNDWDAGAPDYSGELQAVAVSNTGKPWGPFVLVGTSPTYGCLVMQDGLLVCGDYLGRLAAYRWEE